MRFAFPLLQFVAIIVLVSSCGSNSSYHMDVYQTTKQGDYLKLISRNTSTKAQGKVISLNIEPDHTFQEFIGFGASFTESSAWNLATLPITQRKEVLNQLFSPTDGAGFTLTRTHINSCDYSNTHYTYVDEGDTELSSFSIQEDLQGFTGDENDQVSGIPLEDPSYDLIPMILEASQVQDAKFKIIASPWSPPSWMKEGETATMTNGALSPKYYAIWAEYLSKYVSAYKEQGISIWGMTPQNEPLHAHNARWDSNGFTPEQGRDFLKDHLGPQLVKDGHLRIDNLEDGLKVLIYDHNKSTLLDYVSLTYEDPEASKYAWGTAFHWYASSKLEENDWYTNDLKQHKSTYPNKGMIHTESSIDIEANDPIDQYWRVSKDYAGTFIPFQTYAYDIINDLNSGTQGYIEWCMILSNEGKPNPYDNFNSAPVLVNPKTHEVTYTPLYYLISHFSKFIRPEAKRINIEGANQDGIIYTAAKNPDQSIAVVVYNKNEKSYNLDLSIANESYMVNIEPNTMQTIHLREID